MSESIQEARNNPDELDLLSLFQKLFAYSRTYGLLILLCTAAGLITGFVFYKTTPPQYSSTLLLHSYQLTNTEQINIIDNWDALLKNKEYKILGDRLHMDPAKLEQVTMIDAYDIQKIYNANNPNGFVVEAHVTDNNALAYLQNGIVFGLENSGFIREKLANHRESLDNLIAKVNLEISKLDSTKKSIEHSINSDQKGPGNIIVDASSINMQMINLNEKLESYREELKFSNSIQILHPFENFQRPFAPKLLKYIVLGLFGGFIFGYLVSVIFFLRKRLSPAISTD